MKIPPIGFETAWKVHTYEVDNHQRMTIPALIRIMQEAAMQNAIELNFSIWDFKPYNINWVLMRKQLNVIRLPRMEEKIRVGTYPSGFHRFFAYRDYGVFDEDGNVLASSASTWLLMDLKERRAASIPEFVLAIEKDCPAVEHCLPRPKWRLHRFGEVHKSVSFRVDWHDLDFNEHLNNVHYIQWMLEPLPKLVLNEQKLHSLDIHYKEECHWKDNLEAQLEERSNGVYRHRLLNVDTQKEVARMDTEWKRVEPD